MLKSAIVHQKSKRQIFMFDEYADIMSVREMAKALRIGRNAAYELIHNNAIPYRRIGKRILIPKTAVVAFMQSEECCRDIAVVTKEVDR